MRQPIAMLPLGAPGFPVTGPVGGVLRGLLGLLLLAPGCGALAADLAAAQDGDPDPPPAAARRLVISPAERALALAAHMDIEAVSVLSGGLQRGTAIDTVAHAAAASDTAPLGLWAGGRVGLSAIGIRSQEPSPRYVGDLQGVSNIAAPSSARIYQLWYRQQLPGGLGARAGLIDLNEHFAVTNLAGDLLNASFGIAPTLTANVPTSVFPEPGLGAVISAIRSGWQLQGGVFQGKPTDRTRPWHEGYMAIGEAGRRAAGISGKLGLWRYRGTAANAADDWGAYGILEGEIARQGGRRVGAFAQFGTTPDPANIVPHYVGAGLAVAGILPGRPEDRLDMAFARAWVRGGQPETSYELTYVASVAPHVYLQPDLQYVSRPGGTSTVPDAVVGTMRLHFEFY